MGMHLGLGLCLGMGMGDGRIVPLDDIDGRLEGGRCLGVHTIGLLQLLVIS